MHWNIIVNCNIECSKKFQEVSMVFIKNLFVSQKFGCGKSILIFPMLLLEISN